ncbi:MAG: hypothetical protein ABIM83_04180 [candidate division WOR-3 bacterium]
MIAIKKLRWITKFVKIATINLFIFNLNLYGDCLKCHSNLIKDSLSISPHLLLNCNDCHSEFEKVPHPLKIEKSSCSSCHPEVVMNFEKSVHFNKLKCFECHGKHKTISFKVYGGKILVQEKCSSCHKKEGEEYKGSIHFEGIKKGIKDAPTCIDCHYEHKILSPLSPESPVSPKKIPETCAKCHENTRITSLYGIPPRRFSTYKKSYHGIFLYKGELHTANCISCHEYHKILPSSNPESSIHPANLTITCGKCHKDKEWKLKDVKIHVEAKKEVSFGVYVVRVFYICFISFLGFMFLLHIILDLRRRRK